MKRGSQSEGAGRHRVKVPLDRQPRKLHGNGVLHAKERRGRCGASSGANKSKVVA